MQQVDPPIQNNAVSFVLFFFISFFCLQFIVMTVKRCVGVLFFFNKKISHETTNKRAFF
jgi:hypothetical protein